MRIPVEMPRLFKPVQPLMKNFSDVVLYKEYLPDFRLNPYIAFYWEVKSLMPLESPFMYRVVADGCIDIIFAPALPEINFISGFSPTYSEFPVGTYFQFFGVTFYPGTFSNLFNTSVHELVDEPGNLELILPRFNDFLKRSLGPEHTANTVTQCLDDYFLKLLFRVNPDIDNRFYNALYSIYKNKGAFKNEKKLDLGISPRHLRRLFNHHVGDSPKAFSKVIRFQNILTFKPSLKFLKANNFFFDLGYYDQSHFIKEFKKLSGQTPKNLFRYYEES